MNLNSLKHFLILLRVADAQMFASVSRKTSILIEAVSEITIKICQHYLNISIWFYPKLRATTLIWKIFAIVEFSRNLKTSVTVWNAANIELKSGEDRTHQDSRKVPQTFKKQTIVFSFCQPFDGRCKNADIITTNKFENGSNVGITLQQQWVQWIRQKFDGKFSRSFEFPAD